MLKGQTTRFWRFRKSIIFLLSFIISGCSGNFFGSDGKTVLKSIHYSEILGWEEEDFFNSMEAFVESCSFIKKKKLKAETKNLNKKIILDENGKSFFDLVNNRLFDVCLLARNKKLNTNYEQKIFFEDNFQPYLITDNNNISAHFTGYYEPILNGSLSQHREFQYPIYSLPDDVISINLGPFNPDLLNQQFIGRLEGDQMIPYFTREEIENGALLNRNLEIIWLDNPIDLFFLHVVMLFFDD